MSVGVNILVAPKAIKQVEAIGAAIPRLETERLILRACRVSDWPQLEPIWTTERGCYIGGPMNGEDAWLDFAQLTASWAMHGTGGLTIERKADGAVLGVVLICQEFGDPEPEIGWLLVEAAEGQGYAFEAAKAMLPLGLEIFGPGNLVSYIHHENGPSIRLAEKLGATAESKPHPEYPEVLVYRHGEAK